MNGTRTRRTALVGVALALTFFLSACGSRSPKPSDDSATTLPTQNSSTAPPDTAAGANTQAPSTETASTSTPVAATETLIEVPPLQTEDIAGPLVMTADGIGPFKLGMKAQGVIDAMTKIFGQPTDDTDWAQQQSPCEGMGSRSRYVTWGRVALSFADGPTETVKATGEHLSSYFVFDDPDPIAPAERFVLDDGQPALGRTANEMTAWNKNVKFTDSEIEGPVWSVGSDQTQMSGSMDTPPGTRSARVVSVRAGLICVD